MGSLAPPDVAARSDSAAQLFALHGPAEGEEELPAEKASPSSSAAELLAALHIVPRSYRGSKWQGPVLLCTRPSLTVSIECDGEAAKLNFRCEGSVGGGAAPWLTLEGGRDAFLHMLEGRSTLCELVLSGSVWVDSWERCLLFQEAFAFSPEAFAAWRDEQRWLRLREPHAAPRGDRDVLAGGEGLDEDVEAAIQSVLLRSRVIAVQERRQREHGPTAGDGSWAGLVTDLVSCCASPRGGRRPRSAAPANEAIERAV